MTPIELPAGVMHGPTPASNSASWREAHLMRWSDGRMGPVGGWERLDYPAFASRLRTIHVWTSNNGSLYTAFLCEAHLYVDIGGVLTDVSPVVPIVAPYSDTSAGGYGDDVYNLDEFGTPRPSRPRDKTITPSYTLDNWGEDLLAMTSQDGRLLRWSPSTPAVKAVAVPNAPTSNRTFVVTSERYVILFGMGGDSRKFGWCNQEDIEDWNFATTLSKAGFYDVEPASPIITAKAGRGGIVFHTAKKAYHIQHIGLPYVYNYDEIGDSSTPISHASIVSVGDRITWITENGVWAFNGATIDPIACPVWLWVSKFIDVAKSRFEASMVDFVNKSEMWWFFTSKDSDYNDRYIVWNYREGWWSMGRLARSCGVGSSYTTYPILSDGTNVYRHESGTYYPGVDEAPWAETFTINIRSGAGLMTLDQMLPDIAGGNPEDVLFSFAISEQRNGQNAERRTPKQSPRLNGFIDVRQTGRDFRLRVESATISAKPWTMGQTLVDVKVRGKK